MSLRVSLPSSADVLWQDYGRPTTIPVEGETLEMGKFQREYGEALFRIAANVCSHTFLYHRG